MSRLLTRLVRLETAYEEQLAAACERLVRLLTDDELAAIVAVADSPLTPEAEAAFRRVWELASPEERRVLSLGMPWQA